MGLDRLEGVLHHPGLGPSNGPVRFPGGGARPRLGGGDQVRGSQLK